MVNYEIHSLSLSDSASKKEVSAHKNQKEVEIRLQKGQAYNLTIKTIYSSFDDETNLIEVLVQTPIQIRKLIFAVSDITKITLYLYTLAAPSQPQFIEIKRKTKEKLLVHFQGGMGAKNHEVSVKNIRQGTRYQGDGKNNNEFVINNDIRLGETVEVTITAIGENALASKPCQITQFIGNFFLNYGE